MRVRDLVADTFRSSGRQPVHNLLALMDGIDSKGPEKGRRQNITIWCGAGFSKSWNEQSPTDGTLFHILNREFSQLPNLCRVLEALSWNENSHIGFEGFKTLSYIIDMQFKYPDIRNRYLDSQTLKMAVAEMRLFVQRRFAEVSGEYRIDSDSLDFETSEAKRSEQSSVMTFFDRLISGNCRNGAEASHRVNFITTNYDFTIEEILNSLSLQAGPVLPSLYRGITPATICNRRHWPGHDGAYRHTLIKLNGGFEIFRTGAEYHFDYRRKENDSGRVHEGLNTSEPSAPILMLPNRDQDYSDPYFSQIFPKAVRLLRETDILIVIGYSMPWEDVLIRFILHQFAENEWEAVGKSMFYIDLKYPDILEQRLRWTFGSIEKAGWPQVSYFHGSFRSFCEQYVSC